MDERFNKIEEPLPKIEYHCSVCGEPGYMLCKHIMKMQTDSWLAKEQAIKEAYAGLRDTLSLYYAMTGENPHVVPLPFS